MLAARLMSLAKLPEALGLIFKTGHQYHTCSLSIAAEFVRRDLSDPGASYAFKFRSVEMTPTLTRFVLVPLQKKPRRWVSGASPDPTVFPWPRS